MNGLSNIHSTPLLSKSFINDMLWPLLTDIERPTNYDVFFYQFDKKSGQKKSWSTTNIQYHHVQSTSNKRINHCLKNVIMCNRYRIILMLFNLTPPSYINFNIIIIPHKFMTHNLFFFFFCKWHVIAHYFHCYKWYYCSHQEQHYNHNNIT